ncbi:hypothetical protein KKHLCK_17065 [Candidatus Electrothrix laxa]
MKLTVFNGSPRGGDSNTKVLLENFLEGFTANKSNSYELFYLMNSEKSGEIIRSFSNAETVLLAFPLYADAMPGIVKSFIEALQPFCGRSNNPNIGFIVQSGFPEAIHLRYIERYLKKLAARLGCEYKGTVIKGGVEMIRVHSLPNNKAFKYLSKFSKYHNFAKVGHLLDVDKLYRSFYNLGKYFGKTGQFDVKILKCLAQPDKLSRLGFWAFKLVLHLYWNILLKKNNVLDKVSSRPYV